MAMAMPMLGAAFGALLSSSLPKIYEAVGNLEDPNRVEELDQELRHINCRIKEIVEKCKDMSGSQKVQVERMRLLVYDIEDLIDSKDLLGRLQLSAKIKQISGRVVAIQERLKSFNIEEATSKPRQDTSGASTLTSSTLALGEAGRDAPKDEEQFRPQHLQGMKERVDDVLDLVRWPKTETTSEKKLKVISVVGFGGIGKSLLAREVYHSVQVQNEYPVRTFVLVGRRDAEMVLEEIRMEFVRAKELLKLPDKKGKGRSNKSNKGEPGGKGKTVVDSDGGAVPSTSPQSHRKEERKHRYLIVIVDLMEEQLGKRILSIFKEDSVCTEEDDGKKVTMTVAVTVLLTTPILSAAQACRSDHVYKMRPLDDEDSEKLFLHVAGIEKPPSEDEDLIKEIRKKCDGLPLALVSVAKFCGTNMVGRWKEAWRKIGSPKEEDYDLAAMQRVLDHSYASLSSYPLQASLLYFCMFPEGHPIRKGSVIRRWLAEGPEVDCRTSATAGQPEDQMSNATRCFERLVDRNVIWPLHQDVVKTWKPPGVMLEYIKGMSGMLKFIMLSSPDNDKPEDIRRLSLHHSGVADGAQVLRKNLCRLRTLAVFRKAHGGDADLSFANCKMLRLLDLEACNGLKDRHVDEICKQLHLLKYLSIGASITQIPRNIEHLKRLETLDLGIQTVVKVPAEVIMLPGLKHLLGKVELLTNYRPVRSDTKSKKLKRFLKTDSNLQTLAGFVAGDTRGFPQLMRHMENLRKVKIWLGTRVSTTNVDYISASIRDFLARALGMAPTVPFSLSIDFNFQQESTIPILGKLDACVTPPKKRWWNGKRMNTNRHADRIQSQQNPRLGCLASLKLKGFAQLGTVPAFLSNLDFIYELCLSSRVLTWKDILEGASNLGTLKYLKVVEVDGEDKEDNCPTKVLIQKDKMHRLERMCLVANRKLPSLEIEDGALKSLLSLQLICQHLVACVEITCLTKLEEVVLHYKVLPATRNAWKQVAKRHPNTPQVLLIQSP